MIKRLVVGPGAMGFFVHLGAISRLKQEGRLEQLEEISGASAGSLIGFVFCMTKGDIAQSLDVALKIPVKNIVKPNLKHLIGNYGLVPLSRVKKILSNISLQFLNKTDVTFQELYSHFPVKCHVASYCVDTGKTVYFSVDTTPSMSVLDAVCASVAVPFLFSPMKLSDGWNYIDGGVTERIPGAPFIGKSDVFALCFDWGRLPVLKDLKTYALAILYATMKNRSMYDFPFVELSTEGCDVYDFGASNDGKLKMFLLGHSQKIS